jgi:hypothetical protein
VYVIVGMTDATTAANVAVVGGAGAVVAVTLLCLVPRKLVLQGMEKDLCCLYFGLGQIIQHHRGLNILQFL